MSLVRAVISQYLEVVPKSNSCGEDGIYDYYTTIDHDSLIIDNRINRSTGKRRDVFYWNSETDDDGNPIAGDAVTFLMKALSKLKKGLSDKSFREAKRIVKELGGSLSSSPVLITKEVETVTGDIFVPHEGLVNSFWEAGKNNREYWYKRGLTDKTIDKFKLGYDNEGFYVIPVYFENKFINFQRRKDIIEENGSKGKKVFPRYKGMGIIPFNFDNVVPYYKQIIISEAPTDILLAYQLGITNVISTLNGAGKWDQKWYSRFLHVEEFILIYDQDNPGRKGAKKVANMLGVERCWIYTFDGFPEKYDWGDWMKDYPNIDFLEFIKDKKKRSYDL